MHGSGNLKFRQGTLFDETGEPLGMHGTFQPNHEETVHRWYPYLEGFSSTFVQRLVEEFGFGPAMNIYDPFAGSGTTPCVANADGHACYFSEVNPYMQLVIWAKTTGLALVTKHSGEFRKMVGDVAKEAGAANILYDEASREIASAFPGRPYFDERRSVEMVGLRRAVLGHTGYLGRFLRFMIGAISVESSELKRAGDLRYRTPKERISNNHSPISRFVELGDHIYWDSQEHAAQKGFVQLLTNSALDRSDRPSFIDLVVTSPPYINGTNYIRNTKLELWASGLISSERDLRPLRSAAVTSGICDVMKNGRESPCLPRVQPLVTQLAANAYDRRIPEMVQRYFSDADTWVGNIAYYMKAGGRVIIDIGDSRFGGVHVPADEILADIGQAHGLRLRESRLVRPRRSKDGSPLRQVLLVFEVL